MKRSSTQLVVILGIAVLWAQGCGPVDPFTDGNNSQVNTNQNVNTNSNNNWNTTYPDASTAELVRVQGVVWSPGADLATTQPGNRFPIPGAAVIAYSQIPPELPQHMYCNECVEIVDGTPNVIADKVNGSFELLLMPGRSYYLAVQKGEFRRVRQLDVPDTPGQVYVIEGSAPSGPAPALTTLPNHTDLGIGDNIPKIAIVEGAWEDQRAMWEAMGFDYDGEVELWKPDTFGIGEVGTLINDYNVLSQYNLIVLPCGAPLPTGQTAKDNLRQYVEEGGKLYIDDFSYDYAEQVWPEFLSYYVREDRNEINTDFVCGDGPNTGTNACNDWASQYSFAGFPADNDFDGWISLPEVNGNAPIMLEGAWNSIHELGEGEIGVDQECMGNCGPNGEVYALPKVWMEGDTPASGAINPATVSWPFYCGKVLFTVYHTHGTGSGSDYQLMLQEKIMMYLIMEVQTCSRGPIVN